MRPALIVKLAAVAAIAALAACSRTETAPDPIRAVRTLTVSPQTAGGSFDYAGEVKARTESRLSFRVGGKMVKRLVDLGDTVKVGQVLAQLDARDLRLGQDAARASMAAAQASYEQSAADYKRYKELSDKGFIGPAELDRREMAMKTASAQLDQARAQSNVQGNQAGYATLVADVSGVITGVDLEPGMVASAGTPVLRLAHDGPRDVVFSVPEDKVATVKALAGQPGSFTVKVWGTDAPLPATIREISAAADPATRTFLVKADIGTAAAGARLGQTATVSMELPQVAGVNKLPLSALREEQGRSAVWLVDRASMTVKSQEVKLAGADGNEAVITGGLSPGQIVVTAGVHVLSPGQKVKFYVDPGATTAPAASGTPVSVK
ncbi:efflux RND transporter periplasmic adaptor subunit [Rhizobacter sp. Root404]|uniref:efflux RND transporter periplasmic adaptor subunit n=1 Tax=Rhizobacter sp. Root404 TaxID=1736528 RepID=UPI00070044ED|nr:efflux RND transporter periplasmic adaptor subunit [Rhizobacter sp. Root404]KQW36771.1 RND transporter [Rhizobacter sp. Root404]